MNAAVKVMLDRYPCSSINDYENALKEIIQEIALLGLWRCKFFEKAAFYGGSALRILYGLDRFSEDLDFLLLKKNDNFTLAPYCQAVKDELESFGFTVAVQPKQKEMATHINSAFIKASTLQNMIVVDIAESVTQMIHPGKLMKIKMEVDTDPPGDFKTEARYLFRPVLFSVNIYTLPYLFAGKLHAVLCRSWGKRVKGRDWYDLVWYVGREQRVDLKHLKNRMKQTGHLGGNEFLTEQTLKQRLHQKIDTTDFDNAQNDVATLLKDPSSLELWSKTFFRTVCESIRTT